MSVKSVLSACDYVKAQEKGRKLVASGNATRARVLFDRKE